MRYLIAIFLMMFSASAEANADGGRARHTPSFEGRWFSDNSPWNVPIQNSAKATWSDDAMGVFIAGNHCDRLERYLKDKAPELYNFVSIPKILQLEKLGFKYVPYKESYKWGRLYLTHDAGTAGRTAHLKTLDAFQRNVVIGHTHRIAYQVEGNAEGKRHVTASFGWLGDVNSVDYMHKIKSTRDWSLGFGIGYLQPKSGNAHLVPVPIVDYSVILEGQLIKG